MASTLLVADAKNRALRTFLVGLATDVLGAIILLFTPLITNANSWSDLDWKVMGFLLAKTVLSTAFSYLLRTVLDKSAIPTPLPPSDPGEPDKNVDSLAKDTGWKNEAGEYSGGIVGLLLTVLLVLVILYVIFALVR